MSTNLYLATLVRREWLTEGPLDSVVATYIEALRSQRYKVRTIRAYLGCLAHFSYWMKRESIDWSGPTGAALVDRFLYHHLAVCHCPAPCYRSTASSGAALRHLLKLFPNSESASMGTNPLAAELEDFGAYLSDI